jgi:hypothetical protein
MNFIGIDLHKKTISVCVVNQERKMLRRKPLDCVEPDKIVSFLENAVRSRRWSWPRPATSGCGNCWSRWPNVWCWPTPRTLRVDMHLTRIRSLSEVRFLFIDRNQAERTERQLNFF